MKRILFFSIGLLCVSNMHTREAQPPKTIATKPVAHPKRPLKSIITSINSIKEANFKNIDKNALVVFDLVDTLLLSDPSDYNQKLKPSNNLENQTFTEEIADVALSKYMLKLQRRLVEPEHAQFIRILQHKNVKVLVLSHYLVGSYGAIKNLQEWRFKQLFRLDINTSKSFDYETIVLDSFESYRGTKPTYYKGILFTNNFSKGQVLSAFLDKAELIPSIVICFDDNLEYLESVKTYMAQKNISFQGYHYLATQKHKIKQQQSVDQNQKKVTRSPKPKVQVKEKK